MSFARSRAPCRGLLSCPGRWTQGRGCGHAAMKLAATCP